MNPLYDKMFDSRYVNQNYIDQLQYQQFQLNQQIEISKAVKAIRDYCEATRRIAPEFQEEAFRQCVVALLEEMGRYFFYR